MKKHDPLKSFYDLNQVHNSQAKGMFSGFMPYNSRYPLLLKNLQGLDLFDWFIEKWEQDCS